MQHVANLMLQLVADMTTEQDNSIRRAQGKRLAELREMAGFKSARQAALECGWKESSYRAHENGSRTMGRNDAEKYVNRFNAILGRRQADAQYVLFGGERTRSMSVHSNVPVVGRIGAGAEIMPEFEQVPPEGLFEVEVMLPITSDSVAFEVDGDSMYPRYDPGDIVICLREGTHIENAIGREVAVRTSDGRRYLKRIVRGSEPGVYNLLSHNAEPILGVRPEWVSLIDHVIRSGGWRRMTAEERRATAARASL